MKYSLFNKTLWSVIIIGLYTITMHAMEEPSLNNALPDGERTEQEQHISKETDNTKETTSAQAPVLGWAGYLKQWYQGPLGTLTKYVLNNKNIDLNEPSPESSAINNLLEPALKEIVYKNDITYFQALVTSMKDSSITVTPKQKEALMNCYQVLIENHAKSINAVLKEEINKQNDANQKYYLYIQNTVKPLLLTLQEQVTAYQGSLNTKEKLQKTWYDEKIVPTAIALSVVLRTPPLLNEENKAQQYTNYCEAIQFYPQVPKQIERLNACSDQLNTLEEAFKTPLIKNSNT